MSGRIRNRDCLVMLFAGWLAGCGSGDLSAGMSAFEAGEHAAAAEAWIAAGGEQPSADLAYDVATARWHAGEKARALAWWRYARARAPRDGDIQHGLALARADLPGTPDPVPNLPVLEVLSADELAVIAALLLASAVVGGARWLRGGPSTPFLVHAALAAASAGVAVQALDEAAQPVAVVVEGDASVREVPEPASTVRFQLAPGSEVRVSRLRGAWALIEDGKGRRGWTPRSTLEIPANPTPAPVPAEPPPPPPPPTVPA